MKNKSIDAFICSSIKAETASPDIGELKRLLDQMSTGEMQEFWRRFVSDRAFSRSCATVPHWKTKEQGVCFQYEYTSWTFYPKERDGSGKYIVVRKELEEHVEAHLVKHIQAEKQFEEAFKSRPWFDRLHARVGITIVFLTFAAIPIGICLIIISGILHISLYSRIATPAMFVFVTLYVFYLLMPLVRLLLRKCNLWKDPQ